MSTGNANLDLLIKLLSLTTSPLDNEALLAMRKANEQLTKFDTSWEALLKGRVQVVADPFNSVAEPPQRAPMAAPKATGHHSAPRPAPAPPPVRPQPAPPPPRAHHRPQPSQSTQPSSNMSGRPNRFSAICHKCGHRVPAYLGKLSHQSIITGKWLVECDPFCAKPNTKPSKATRSSVDNLGNMLD